ncbi:unnamed protein product [Urochloa decumbens]|uniref:Uncharacterized protein n=1 Tax=Urochloa decumbens TaxID=240449 RepID=A0ABC8W9E2_9POAL
MARPKRRRGDGDPDGPPMAARPQEERRLYLIFDDYPWGYSVREMNLPPPPSSRQDEAASSSASGERRRFPPPIICFEASRGYPLNFAAAGTAIVSTHSHRDPSGDSSVPDGFLPIVDVRWRGVTFGPGQAYPYIPIYLPAVRGDAVFALDASSFSRLSLAPLWPPRLEHRGGDPAGPRHGIHGEPPWWAWQDLPPPPFNRSYDAALTSYAVPGDGRTFLFSAEIDDPIEATLLPDGVTVVFGEVTSRPATFAFDTAALAWERRGEWALPFAGRGHFVPSLDAFVGLSGDPATSGHPCSCSAAAVATAGGGGGSPPAWKLGKEKLFSEDPAETHVGATVLYTGNGSEFCLVECVSIAEHGDGDGDDAAADQEEEHDEETRRRCHVYRLTTFSLSYDDNGDLTTAGTCRVQCYEVPEETTEKFLRKDPVAFWL